MTIVRLLVAGALLAPSLVFVSCTDDGDSSPVGPRDGRAPTSFSEQQADLATAASKSSGGTAPHDPTVSEARVQCVVGVQVTTGVFEGIAAPFRGQGGCEMDTRDRDGIPFNEFTYVVTAVDRMRGALVAATQRLEFYYAGGDGGSSLQFQLFVDNCLPATESPDADSQCPVGTSTDGVWDESVLIPVDECHDEPAGSRNIGAALVRAPDGNSDETCRVISTRTGVYPNFQAYMDANQGARYALTMEDGVTPAQNSIAQSGGKHFLVYRVDMRADKPVR